MEYDEYRVQASDGFAACCHIDGIVLDDRIGIDHAQTLVHIIARYAGKTYDEVLGLREFKLFVINGRVKEYPIYRIQLTGWLASTCRRMIVPFRSFLKELHFKTYIPNFSEAEADEFSTALHAGEGYQQMTLSGKKRSTNAKGNGVGWRIGSRKAAFHCVSYRRRAQLQGLELRLGGVYMGKVRAHIEEALGGDDEAKRIAEWIDMSDNALDFAAGIAYGRFAREAVKRQVEIAEYVEGFADAPDDTVPPGYKYNLAEGILYKAK